MNPFALTHRLRFSLLLLAGFTLTTAEMEAQERKEEIRLEVTQKPLSQVFRQLEKRTDYKFVYSHDDVRGLTAARDVQAADIKTALEQLLQGLPLKYSIEGKFVYIVSDRDASSPGRQVRQKRTTVSGQVVDAQGNPLPGATVVVKGTTIGTATDMDGRYTLAVPEGDHTLQVSMVGMRTENVPIRRRTHINVSLTESVEMMDEVVVTGYQTISKERATGAYSIIDSDVLDSKTTTNLAEALNGLVPGLVTATSSVDDDLHFVIRGKGTLQEDQAESDPLIVVDGFAITGYTDGNDPFSTINPNDVESVTVLKDAAATSIYGARAANGVIVITTKKGQTGNKLDISVDANWSIKQRADMDYYFNMASAESQFRFVELMTKYIPVTAANDPYADPRYHKSMPLSAPYRLIFERDVKHNITDEQYLSERARLIDIANRGLWKKDIDKYVLRRGFTNQYNVALRGATEKLNYNFSASYDGEKGYVKGDDNRRMLLNMGASAKITDALTFDASLNTMITKAENNGVDLAGMKSYISPWSRLADDNGNLVNIPYGVYGPILETVYAGKTPADWHYNPVADRQYMDNTAETMYYRVQGGLTYKTPWGLNLSAKGQYEWRRYDTHEGYDPESYYVRDLYNTYSTLNPATGMYDSYFPQGGIFTDGGHTYKAYNLRAQADYSWTKDKHALSVLAGTEILSSTQETTPSITRYGYNKYTNAVDATIDYETQQFTNIFGVDVLNPFKTLGALSTYEDRFFSVYANASYTYDERYSATVSFRTDASNYQSESQRDKFSPFWSVGGSWLLSRERFLQQASWLNMLKLRASFGIAGVAAGKKSTSSVTTVSTNLGTTIFPGSNSINARGNETLTWEKSRTFNVGVDLSVFDNKLSGSIDFYNKYSYDVLSDATVPAISQGVDHAMFNNAEVLNRGIELSLSSNLRIVDDLRWRGTVNYAYNYNKVTNFELTSPITPSNPGYMEGYPIGSILALKPVGYTPEGYVQLQGKDGTLQTILDSQTSHTAETISRDLDESNWFYYVGSMTPTSNLSFSNYFMWRGLTLSFMITGRFGYRIYRGDNDDFTSATYGNYSKQLDKSFAVYDQGYANQKDYSAFPLYNDANFDVYKSLYTNLYFANLLFDTNYVSGDHIRLNEVYLGYDFPEKLLSRQRAFSRVNVYARASNLGVIWSKNGDIDPDYPIGSIKPMPTFTFGLKVGF